MCLTGCVLEDKKVYLVHNFSPLCEHDSSCETPAGAVSVYNSSAVISGGAAFAHNTAGDFGGRNMRPNVRTTYIPLWAQVHYWR